MMFQIAVWMLVLSLNGPVEEKTRDDYKCACIIFKYDNPV
jgi:hypothetical protein